MTNVYADCGVYIIHNIASDDCYIGQSIGALQRLRNHHNALLRGNHGNKHLQAAFNKYDNANFVFKVLVCCEDYELVYYEDALTKRLHPAYAKRLDCVTSNKGCLQSDEFKHAISQSLLGNCRTLGHKASDETKLKMSKSRMGRPGIHYTDEIRHNMSVTHLGKSPGNKGKKASGEVLEHISKAQQLRFATQVVSDETKRKMSKSQRLRRLKERSIDEEKKLLGTVTSGG